MAAKKFYNVFEVIEKVTESDETNEDGDSYDEGDQVEEIVQSKMTELAEAAVKLEPALQPNIKLFETHAVRIILPCYSCALTLKYQACIQSLKVASAVDQFFRLKVGYGSD